MGRTMRVADFSPPKDRTHNIYKQKSREIMGEVRYKKDYNKKRFVIYKNSVL